MMQIADVFLVGSVDSTGSHGETTATLYVADPSTLAMAVWERFGNDGPDFVLDFYLCGRHVARRVFPYKRAARYSERKAELAAFVQRINDEAKG